MEKEKESKRMRKEKKPRGERKESVKIISSKYIYVW